jgi:hypothetical protein
LVQWLECGTGRRPDIARRCKAVDHEILPPIRLVLSDSVTSPRRRALSMGGDQGRPTLDTRAAIGLFRRSHLCHIIATCEWRVKPSMTRDRQPSFFAASAALVLSFSA